MSNHRLSSNYSKFSLLARITTLAVVVVCSCAVAQEVTTDNQPNTSPDEVSIQSLPPGFHLIQKDAVTNKVTLHREVAPQILKDVQDRHMNQERRELFDIQQLEINGAVDKDLVTLTAEIFVDIQRDNEWVQVPVGFDNFHLTNLAHSSTTPKAVGRFDKSQLPKKTWQLYGKGQHKIQLEMVGRLKSLNQRQRLQLAAPNASISHVILTCPEPIESVALSSGEPFHLRIDDATASSEIETWGLKPDSELSWLSRPASHSESVTVQSVGNTKMKLYLTTASMTVLQPLSISGGAVSELNVRIPEDFVLASVRATDSEGRNVVNPAERDFNASGLIRFTGPVTGTVTLEYDLSLRRTSYPQNISVQMPDLLELPVETAELEIFVPVGLEVEVTRSDDNNARQKRVESQGTPRTADVAYWLLSHSAKIELAVSETEAFFSISPLVTLETEQNAILLTSRFAVNMVRGSLNEMEIKWPEFRKEGWTILDVQMSVPDSETKIPVARSDSDDAFRITFPGRQSGKFEIEVQAARDLALFQETDHLLFLPDIEASAPHTTTVSLIESDAFSMTLAAGNRRDPFPSFPASRLPKDLQNRNIALSAWLVDTTEEAVELAITPQKPEVRASVLAEVSVALDNIHVSEVISFDVLHRDLSEIRLNVPAFSPSVRLEGETEALTGTATAPGVVTYVLPEALRGRFNVHVDFYWAPPVNVDLSAGSAIDIPLVLPNAPDQLNEIIVATNAPRSLSIAKDIGWTRIHSDHFAAAWISGDQQELIPVTLHHSLSPQVDSPPSFLVMKSTAYGTKLVTSVTAVFGEPTNAVLFSISSDCVAQEGYIGSQEVQIEPIVSEDRTTIQLRLPESSTQAGQTTATLIFEQEFASRYGLFATCKPEVPRVVGQDNRCNALWVIAEKPDTSLLHLGGSMVEVTSSLAIEITQDPSQSPIAGAAALVAPYDRDTQQTVLDLLNGTFQSADQYSLFAGTVQERDHVIVSVPRRTMLLATAIIGILIYFAVIRLQVMSLLTTMAIVTAAITALVAIAPNPGSIILQRLAPGCVLAIIAASLQRFFTRDQTVAPVARNDADYSTIFTVEESMDDSVSAGTSMDKTAMMTPT